MALGTSRTRNWGKEAQAGALAILLQRAKVAYKVCPLRPVSPGQRRVSLWLTPSHNGLTLPFYGGSCAELVTVRRDRWEARHLWDGRVLASGCSLMDVVRATIQQVWH